MRSIQFEGVAQTDLQRNQIFLIDKCGYDKTQCRKKKATHDNT